MDVLVKCLAFVGFQPSGGILLRAASAERRSGARIALADLCDLGGVGGIAAIERGDFLLFAERELRVFPLALRIERGGCDALVVLRGLAGGLYCLCKRLVTLGQRIDAARLLGEDGGVVQLLCLDLSLPDFLAP